MKCLIIVAFVATLASVHAAATGLTEEMKAKMKQHLDECQESLKVTDEEIAKLRNNELPADSKCFTNCYYEKFEIIKDGVVQEAKLLEGYTSYIGEEKAKQIVDLCRGETGADKCETAYKLQKCFRANKGLYAQ